MNEYSRYRFKVNRFDESCDMYIVLFVIEVSAFGFKRTELIDVHLGILFYYRTVSRCMRFMNS